jgi:hypothetical protein
LPFAATLYTLIVGIALFVLHVLNIQEPIVARLTVAILFAIGTVFTTLSLYGYRCYQLLTGQKVSASLRVENASNTDEEKEKLLKAARVALKAIKSEEGKCALCTEQIAFWYGTLTAISLNEYKSGSGASKVSGEGNLNPQAKSLAEMKAAAYKDSSSQQVLGNGLFTSPGAKYEITDE